MKKKTSFVLMVTFVCILVCGIVSCGNPVADPFINEKTAAINEVNAVVLQKNSADYTSEKWAVIELHLQDATTKINGANDTEAINTAKQEAIDKINAVETIVQGELNLAKINAIGQLEYYLLSYLYEAEYSEENWAEINALFEEKKSEINQAYAMNSTTSYEICQEFYINAYLVDKATDIYKTVYVTVDGATDDYCVRYRYDERFGYEFDQLFQVYSGLPSLSEKLRILPKKDGNIFLGWFFSSTSDTPYDFSRIFAPFTPQTEHVFARFKQIPTTPIAGIDDIVGTWTAQYKSGSGRTLGDVEYDVFADATLIIDEFGLVTFSATYTIEGVSEEEAQSIFAETWEKSKEIKILCEFDEHIEYSEYAITYYNLFYYSFNAIFDHLYPVPNGWKGMLLQDSILSFDNGEFTKQA